MTLLENCYGEICNHHRNILNKEPCHRSSEIEENRETPWTEHDNYYTFSLCKYFNKLSLFKPIVHIYSFISFTEYYLLIIPILSPPQDISYKKLWNIKVTVIPIIIGVLGTIPQSLISGLQKLEIGGQTTIIQIIA